MHYLYKTKCSRLLCVFLFVLAWAGCESKEVSSSGSAKTFNFYSIQDDIELGEQVEKQQLKELDKKGITYDTEAKKGERNRLDAIMKKIIAASDMPNLPYALHYVEAPIVNAMCIPGGKVFVYEGLSDPKKGLVDGASDAEFAAVLGHEYAHATMRHVTRQVSRYQSFSVLGSIAGGVLGASFGEGAAQLFGRFYSFGAMFYFPKYSRKYETEADLVGARYMAKAGYDPRTAIILWRRAAEKRKAEGKVDATNILASHPASGDRAKRLEQEMPTILPYYKATKP